MDLLTLHIEHAVLLAVYTLLTVANSRIHKGIRGIHWFSLYNLLLFLGALLVSVRGHVPGFASIVFGNMFVIWGYLALFVSLARFFGKDFGKRLWQLCFQLALAILGLAAMLQWGWLHPDTNKRLLAYSIVLLAQQAHLAVFAARKERRSTHAVDLMASVLFGLAAMNGIRIVTVLLQGVPQDYLSVKGTLVLMVLVNNALQCAATVSYIWMTASLLRGDLAHQASTDPLTGLLNRRAMDRAAAQVLAAATPGHPASAITIDLNDFKRINDTFGHSTGDAMLAAAARTLQLGLRHSDFVGRMGGDEFVALLPDTPVETARQIAAKLDAALCSIAISPNPAGPDPAAPTPAAPTEVRISASFGCAQSDIQPGPGPGIDPVSDWDHLLAACDKLLYKSKSRRRSDQADAEPDSTNADTQTPEIPIYTQQ
jgi:diguanylate cyclase (GGDEF)-like protein